MVETRATELQVLIEERDNLREEVRTLRLQQGLRETDSHLEEVAEASENDHNLGCRATRPPPPRQQGLPRRPVTISSMGTQGRYYDEITTDDHKEEPAAVAKRAPPVDGFVNMILDGERDSNRQTKKNIRGFRQIQERNENGELAKPMIKDDRRAHRSEPIGFTAKNLEGVMVPHNDPLVITVMIGNCSVFKVLVDCGSDVDILFTRGLDQMRLSRECLQHSTGPIYGFSGGFFQPIGEITLPVTAGIKLCCQDSSW
ncbi:hypothetical protein FRX31_005375 [Thalictrum thalictroides]|uniref:Uncharacterized protein n=1 Tax=Thalictrum thalictroides TaxID=46969 RepID=A0A7J6X7L4_THATH|nr:hypothetical protein FRX31_005375 [Thalictrum thalictroides]